MEMLDHVIESLVMNSRSTVHILEKKAGNTVLETAFATAMAFGRVLRFCALIVDVSVCSCSNISLNGTIRFLRSSHSSFVLVSCSIL